MARLDFSSLFVCFVLLVRDVGAAASAGVPVSPIVLSIGNSVRTLFNESLRERDVELCHLVDETWEQRACRWPDGALDASTRSACLADASDGKFRAYADGDAFSVIFDPPRDGCYLIEEYHPGGRSSSSSQECSRQLHQSLRVDVDYCVGWSAVRYVDQSTNGSQWNSMGSFLFYAGTAGRFSFTSVGDENNCQAADGRCFWAFDALRATWLGEHCESGLTPTFTLPPTLAEPSTVQAFWYVGLLVLGLRTPRSTDGQRSMRSFQSTFESALAGYFSLSSAKVVSVEDISRFRRLSGVQVRFEAVSSNVLANSDGLAEPLQSALEVAGANVTVQFASVEWFARVRPGSERDDSFPWTLVVCALMFTLLIALVSYGLCLLGRRRLRLRDEGDKKQPSEQQQAAQPPSSAAVTTATSACSSPCVDCAEKGADQISTSTSTRASSQDGTNDHQSEA